MRGAIVLCVISLCLQLRLAGQPPLTLRAYDRAHGMPSDYIHSMLQDRKGFLWFATDQGIARYDGRQYLHLTKNEGLTANQTLSLYEDRAGRMWVGTFEGGACRYDGRQVWVMRSQPGNPAFHNTVYAMADDAFDRMYFMGDQGLMAYYQDRIELLLADPTQANTESRSIITLPDGSLLACMRQSLLHIQPQGTGMPTLQSLRYARTDSIRWGIGPKLLYKNLYRLPGGGVAVHTSKGIYAMTLQDGMVRWLRQCQPDIGANDYVEINDSTTYMASQFNGLVMRRGGSIHTYNSENLLPVNYATCLLRDYEGNLWVGTYGGGAYRVMSERLTWLRTQDGLMGENVAAVHPDGQGNLWVGSTTGISCVAGRAPHRVLHTKAMPNVRALHTTPEGALWAGNFAALHYYQQATAAQPDKTFTEENGVADLMAVPDEGMWVATAGSGLYLATPDRYQLLLNARSGLATNLLEKLAMTDNGYWLLTASDGAMRVNGSFIRYYDRTAGLPTNAIYCVYQARDSSVWLGTDKGACLLQGPQVQLWGKRQGLLGKRTLCVFEQVGDSSIYILTEQCLHRLAHGQLQALGSVSLLPEANISINRVIYDAKQRRLLLGTTRGLVLVQLGQLQPNLVPPRVAVVAADADGVAQAIEGSVYLAPGQGNLNIRFAGLSFANELGVRYRYRLRGVDDNYGPPTTDPEVQYRNLPHGQYVFQVVALNADGVVSNSPAELRIVIPPPFYASWWFRTLAVLLVVGLTVFIVRYLTRRRLLARIRSLQLQGQIQAERERISRDLHDHVGAQLTSMLAGLELAGRLSTTNHPKLRDSLQDLRQDALTTIGQLRETIWTLNQTSVPHEQLISRLQLQARQLLRAYPEVVLQVYTCAAELPQLSPTQAMACYRVGQEALHNCIKHAQATKIVLQDMVAGEQWILSIQDDGVGFDPIQAPKQGHYGLQNMRQRCAEVGAGIEWISGLGAGTEVRISIPLSLVGKNT